MFILWHTYKFHISKPKKIFIYITASAMYSFPGKVGCCLVKVQVSEFVKKMKEKLS